MDKESKSNFFEKVKNNLWTYDLNNYKNIMGHEIQSMNTIFALKSFFLEKLSTDDNKGLIKIAKFYSYLGLTHTRLGLYDEAKSNFINEMDHLYREEKTLPAISMLKVVNHINIGNVYFHLNELKMALYCYKYGFDILDKIIGDKNDSNSANIESLYPLLCYNVGQLCESLFHYDDAFSFYNMSQQWYGSHLPTDTNFLLKNSFTIVQLLIKTKNYDKISDYCVNICKYLREKMYNKKLNYHLFNWDRQEHVEQQSTDSSSSFNSEDIDHQKRKSNPKKSFKIATLFKFKSKLLNKKNKN